MSDSVEYARDGAVATLWLNRPEARNAYDQPMLRALQRALGAAERDAAVRAIVVRGRGESFCVGADPAMLDSGASWIALSRRVAGVFDRLAESPKVTIAAVHGHAVAGGFELMLACDFAVATEDALIGDRHIRSGLFGSVGATHRLPRIVGLRRAKELLLSGDLLTGGEALAWNLVNAVCAAADLDAAVAAFAARFTGRDPTATWLTKLAANRAAEASSPALQALEQLAAGVIESQRQAGGSRHLEIGDDDAD